MPGTQDFKKCSCNFKVMFKNAKLKGEESSPLLRKIQPIYIGAEALCNPVSYSIKFFQKIAIPGPSPMLAGFYNLKDIAS